MHLCQVPIYYSALKSVSTYDVTVDKVVKLIIGLIILVNWVNFIFYILKYKVPYKYLFCGIKMCSFGFNALKIWYNLLLRIIYLLVNVSVKKTEIFFNI